MDKQRYTQLIKEEAYRLGFQHCGISEAKKLDEEARELEEWLNQGHHGQMKWMENHFEKRIDPRKLVPGAKSVISVLLNYYTEAEQKDPEAPKIAKYAYGQDYHPVVKKKLKALLRFIRDNIGHVEGRAFVDSAPVMDSTWAKRSGLGWKGKNTLLLNRQEGSFFFVGELIVDLPLEYDAPMKDYCGTCTRCIDACPTDAIYEPYKIDGSKCISYYTIELKDELPDEMAGKFENWAFGCDICQQVCPWNKFAEEHEEPALDPIQEILDMTKEDWEEITKETFDKVFRHSPLRRAKYEGIKRNMHFLKQSPPASST